MGAPPSAGELVLWRHGSRRCELWAWSDGPELRVFFNNVVVYTEHAPLESLYERAEQLRRLRQPRER